MRVEPASSEFSRSSLTTDAGRSTTSPAAILLATDSERTWMRPMVGGKCQVSQMRADKAKASTDLTDEHGLNLEVCVLTRARVMFNFLFGDAKYDPFLQRNNAHDSDVMLCGRFGPAHRRRRSR